MTCCCSACFADPFLSARIEASGLIGACSTCGCIDVPIIDSSELADYFRPLLTLYVSDPDGLSLHHIVQRDWGIFAVDDDDARADLLSAISLELGVVGERFVAGEEPSKDLAARWEAFSHELKYENRFLPDLAPEVEVFTRFGDYLGTVFEPGKAKFYRARVNEDERQFAVHEMLKPPASIVTNGRANPLGIPYLYVASDPQTAIAEVRGHKGDRVTVVEFDVVAGLGLFDLRAPRSAVSPFSLQDDIGYLPYFEHLGSELSKPITPRRANLDYLPSQYLCEVIRKGGHHGILYRSSIADGFNCVVFADERLVAGAMHEYTIVETRCEADYLRALP